MMTRLLQIHHRSSLIGASFLSVCQAQIRVHIFLPVHPHRAEQSTGHVVPLPAILMFWASLIRGEWGSSASMPLEKMYYFGPRIFLSLTKTGLSLEAGQTTSYHYKIASIIPPCLIPVYHLQNGEPSCTSPLFFPLARRACEDEPRFSTSVHCPSSSAFALYLS